MLAANNVWSHEPTADRSAPWSSAFEDEVVRLVPLLCSRALRLERGRADADDLIQETILRAFERRWQFAPGSNLRQWLCTIMQNLFLDRCRERVRRYDERWEVAELTYQKDAPEIEEVPAPWEGITRTQIGIACGRLGPPLREAAMLVFFEGLSYKHAALRLGVGVSTIGTRLHRARARLRPLLRATAA